MDTSGPRIPARFDPDPWDEDLAHSTPNGRQAAEAGRRDYEPKGIPRSHLKPCKAEGQDGTMLPQCFKVYVPQPDGKFGMVFKSVLIAGQLQLDFLAFGVRHHPKGSHALTLYEVAHIRLQDHGRN